MFEKDKTIDNNQNLMNSQKSEKANDSNENNNSIDNLEDILDKGDINFDSIDFNINPFNSEKDTSKKK